MKFVCYILISFLLPLGLQIYNEQEVDEMILLIRDSFIPAFVGLEKTLRSKLEEVKNDWE